MTIGRIDLELHYIWNECAGVMRNRDRKAKAAYLFFEALRYWCLDPHSSLLQELYTEEIEKFLDIVDNLEKDGKNRIIDALEDKDK